MERKYALIIDQERCIGCEACTVACRIEHNGVQGHIRVSTQDSLCKDTPAGVFPNLRMAFLPALCNHCELPPCLEACPLEAISKKENGIVFLDKEICDGCRTCLEACPYGAIIFNHEKDKAEKCNLCAHRIEQGQEPFCVICCEGQAIYFGDLNDPASSVSKLLSSGKTFCLQPEFGTKPRVHYCPPKEPQGL
ncbi:MAG: 4Fe-4S dicluster domain-containing protein [Desulfobacterales bacterium]|nr:MAG: 4Fe-4S dicluster domain-containing protein [Desulfobacterales bacterium]